MVGADGVGIFEVGDGSCDFADFVVCAGAEGELGHSLFEHLLAGFVELAECFDVFVGHGGVGHEASVAEAGGLAGAGGLDHVAKRRRVVPVGFASELAEGDGGDLDVDVDTVQKWAGDFAHIPLDLDGGAFAAADVRAVIAAGAGVHGGDHNEVGGKPQRALGAGDGDGAFFEGLADHFEDVALELGEFVEEEDAVMGQAEFAGARVRAAADERRAGGGVVRGADGARGDEGLPFGQEADGGIDARGFEGFGQGQRREDGGHALGEHGFACAGRADHHDVVASGGGDGEGAFDAFLSFDIRKIDVVGGGLIKQRLDIQRGGFDLDGVGEKTGGLSE